MLNTKLDDCIEMSVPLETALKVCRKAVANIGWRILNQSPNRLCCKEVAVSGMSFNWPAEIELVLSSSNSSHTQVFLHGSIFGMGPIQKGHLQGQLGNLRNRLELQLAEIQTGAQPEVEQGSDGVSLASELEKLAALLDSGILTDDEFKQAKQRLLESG